MNTSHKLKLAQYRARRSTVAELSDNIALIVTTNPQYVVRHIIMLRGVEHVYQAINWRTVRQQGDEVTFRYANTYSEMRRQPLDWELACLKLPKDDA